MKSNEILNLNHNSILKKSDKTISEKLSSFMTMSVTITIYVLLFGRIFQVFLLPLAEDLLILIL